MNKIKDGEYRDALGNFFWFKDENLHREDGPALVVSGNKHYYKHGNLHREDGPAYENTNGYKEWWIDGKKITEEEFKQKHQKKQE